MKNRYYFFRNDQRTAHFEFDPHDPKCLDDVEYKYFGRVLNELEPKIKNNDLIIYVTAWTTDELPMYGPNVVSFILQDEFGRDIPYRDKVKAVFKTCGKTPYIANAYKHGSFIEKLVNFATQTRHFKKSAKTRIKNNCAKYLKNKHLAPVYEIPIGYFANEDIPFIPFEKRENDLYFAGSIQHVKRGKIKISSPKEAARDRMNSALAKMNSKMPHIKFKSLVTDGYGDSIKTDNSAYLYNMMNTKICPIPRGANLETYRFYEAIRYGCIPVGECFPNAWYYEDAPIVHIDNWEDLPTVADNLLQDQEKLQKLHKESLDWWNNKCSEKALAQYISEKIQ